MFLPILGLQGHRIAELVQDLGFGVLGFWVQDLGFGVLGFWV